MAEETSTNPQSGSSASGAVPEDSIETLREHLEQARAEALENLDKYLRASAETENVRRRAETEVANARKFSIERFAAEMLPVRDALELASQVDLSGENSEAVSRMHEGIELTLKQFDTAFEKFHITTIDPAGEKFDPERHQAMTMVERADMAPNHVVQVVQKGYLIHDRLLRPAMVVVSKAAAGA
jgi:molecular chaperone GrpE